MATNLSSDLTKPQPTTPGDAPADTTDWHQRAQSATPNFAAAAEAGYQSVNAVVPGDPYVEPVPTGDRTETYEAFNSQGEAVTVTHNLDTGQTSTTATPPA